MGLQYGRNYHLEPLGTWQDFNEAITFAADDLLKATIRTATTEAFKDIFGDTPRGKIAGRIVPKLKQE